mgnify:CR=1 FL=1
MQVLNRARPRSPLASVVAVGYVAGCPDCSQPVLLAPSDWMANDFPEIRFQGQLRPSQADGREKLTGPGGLGRLEKNDFKRREGGFTGGDHQDAFQITDTDPGPDQHLISSVPSSSSRIVMDGRLSSWAGQHASQRPVPVFLILSTMNSMASTGFILAAA